MDVAIPYNGDDCIVWPFATDENGYGRIGIDGKVHVTSRYVCERVNGPPPTKTHEAAHKCGNGHLGCVTPKHLKWKSRVENQLDRVIHGTSNRGTRQGQSKLTEDDVRAIRLSAASLRKTAGLYGISRSTVWEIKRRDVWGWLPD